MSLPCANNHEHNLYSLYLSFVLLYNEDGFRKPHFIITGNCESVLESQRKQEKIIIVPILTLLVSMSRGIRGGFPAPRARVSPYEYQDTPHTKSSGKLTVHNVRIIMHNVQTVYIIQNHVALTTYEPSMRE